ncbi:response regulator [Haliangium sp.]|uniref:response regulator n=1 Tax=Haliangium sp. TaxID=2663208 RepID=UPI003D10D08F
MARILIVDDEQFVRNALCRALKGHDLVTAANGEEALQHLTQSGAPFDLILCDLMMPGVSGMDLYRHLGDRQPSRQAQFVFLTGGVFTDEAQDFITHISNPVIQKPFNFQQLRGIVRARIGANPSGNGDAPDSDDSAPPSP